MAIYKIFPYKDTTLYSLYPNMSTGLDAISEIVNRLGVDGTPDVSRFITQFDTTEIQNVINNKIGSFNSEYFITLVKLFHFLFTIFLNLEFRLIGICNNIH